MTTEEKALAMVRKEDGHGYLNYDAAFAALCRAIEQHEAFRQEVSDAVVNAIKDINAGLSLEGSVRHLRRLIIPAPKPDPIAEAWIEATGNTVGMEPLNAALEARGLEIREKNDD